MKIWQMVMLILTLANAYNGVQVSVVLLTRQQIYSL